MDNKCQQCRRKFSGRKRKFCDKKCSYTYYNRTRTLKPNVFYDCIVCGKHVEKYLAPSAQASGVNTMEFCSRTCKGKHLSGDRHPLWKGGQWKSSDYVHTHFPSHPCADHHGTVPEHRLVMEKYLGRYLEEEEVVHHRDSNPGNNELSNLKLFATHADHMAYHSQNRERNSKGQYVKK